MKHEASLRGILLLVGIGLLTSCASPPPQQPPQQEQQQQQAAPADQPSAQTQEPEKPEMESEPAQPSPEAAGKPKLAVTADVDAGKSIYAKKCVACHGEQGEGKAALAKMLKVELRPLGSSQVQAKSDEELRRDISEGTGKMKGVTGVSDADLANLVAFLRTLK